MTEIELAMIAQIIRQNETIIETNYAIVLALVPEIQSDEHYKVTIQ